MSRLILVVEDDLAIRESVAEILEEEGHSVVMAEHGQGAISKLQAMVNLPDLILLDLMMPVKDGLQFRAEQRPAHIPVVVMSADPRLKELDHLLGAKAYLRKPFDMRKLIEIAQ